jgi:glycosyltransferase involved in cell wall biosynthesis
MNDLTIIIPTFNEEIHIERSIKSAQKISENIFIVDSYSTDKTIEIAKDLNVQIMQGTFVNLSHKLNWAINNSAISTKWVMRLDADEYITDELINEINLELPKLDTKISGIAIRRRIHFLGKWVKRGSYPISSIRIFKHKNAFYEKRLLDEHLIIRDGDYVDFSNDIVDDNLNTLSSWIIKHNKYAILEAIELINYELSIIENKIEISCFDQKTKIKRQNKEYYARLPLFFRAFLFFIYKYFIMLAFLEGRESMLWNFFQCLWYRILADATVYDIYKHCGKDRNKIIEYIYTTYGIDCRTIAKL